MKARTPLLAALGLLLLLVAALIWSTWRKEFSGKAEPVSLIDGPVTEVERPHRSTWQATDPETGRWNQGVRPVSSAETEPFLGDAPGVELSEAGLAPRGFDRRERVARLAKGLSLTAEGKPRGRRFEFNLFPDTSFTGAVTRHDTLGADRGVYYGYLEDSPVSQFIIAYEGDVAAAALTDATSGTRYEIRPGRDGHHRVVEIDEALIPRCGMHPDHPSIAGRRLLSRSETEEIAATSREIAAAQVSEAEGKGVFITGPAPDPATVEMIDCMLLYSDDARAANGGTSGMNVILDLAVATANACYANSGIGVELRLVHRQEMAYSETNIFNTDLSNLANSSGELSTVNSLRTTHGADVVSMFLHDGDGGGLGYLYNGFPNTGFSVVLVDAGIDTMAHEIGHNQGCAHDRENTGVFGEHSYSHGWRTRLEEVQVRTVMSYSPGFPLPFFSSPEVELNGVPIGVEIGQPLESANVATINATASTIAGYLSPGSNQPPTVTLTSPTEGASFVAMEPVTLTASASDDVSVDRVDFFLVNSNLSTTSLGSDTTAPFEITAPSLPAGEVRVMAVARDNQGASAVDQALIGVGPAYTIETVPAPTGFEDDVEATAINEEGVITGIGINPSSQTRGFIWDGTALSTAAPLPGDTSTELSDININNVAVGFSSGATTRAIRSTPGGSVEDLEALIQGAPTSFPHDVLEAHGIADSGAILVEVDNPTSSETDYYIWDGVTTMTPLQSSFNAGNIQGRGISPAGTVTGHDYDFDVNAWRAATWDSSGVQTFLPRPEDDNSRAFAVNNDGYATGYWGNADSIGVWLDGFNADIGTLGGAFGWGRGINIHQEAVGESTLNSGILRATLFKDGVLRSLGDLVWEVETGGGTRQWFFYRALDINDRGEIVGSGEILLQDPDDDPDTSDADFFSRAFILKPTAGLERHYWDALQFTPAELDDPAISGSLADLDGDGKSNLIEWALNTDPRDPDTYRPMLGVSDGYLTLTFRQLKSRSDLEYIVEVSTDLVKWTPADTRIRRVTIDASTDEVVVRAPAPMAGVTRQFMRLRVVEP